MGGQRVMLVGGQYALGEIESDHTTIPNLAQRAQAFGMPVNAKLWGWGTFRRTERSLEELAIDSGTASLRAAGLDPSSIDAIIVCSTLIPGPSEDHGRFFETILTGVGLGDIAFYGQTLNRCTNLMAALDVAKAFVSSGRYRRILVITTDKVANEADRMASYALFSDGAASCIVTSDVGDDEDGYELIACATAQEASSLEWSKEISSDLSRQVNDHLLAPLDMKLDDVAGLMHSNIFKPLVVMKERQAGFSAEQIYIDNIVRLGHCFAADPVINLVDRAAAGQMQAGRYYILASSVPGSRIGALLRKRPW
jgi:3-oxoacyl-[acyl-carrier-protein] synthase III